MNKQLTSRELQVLKFIALGYSNFDIAVALKLKKSTVEGYIKIIYLKLNIWNQPPQRAKARAIYNEMLQNKGL